MLRLGVVCSAVREGMVTERRKAGSGFFESCILTSSIVLNLEVNPADSLPLSSWFPCAVSRSHARAKGRFILVGAVSRLICRRARHMPIRIRLIAKRTSRVDAQLGSTIF